MKKSYLQPETEILYLRNMEMIAMSIIDTPADPDEPVLSREDKDWDIWGNEE